MPYDAVEGLRADHADRDHAQRARRQRGARRSTTCKEFIAYAKANPGKLVVRLRQQRQRRPSRRRAVQGRHRHRHRAHSVQGRRARDAGAARRRHAVHVRQPRQRDGAGEGGQAEGARRHHGASARSSCPTCRRWPRPACPGFDISTWFGFFAPAGTPPAIIAKWNADVDEDPELAGHAREARSPRARNPRPTRRSSSRSSSRASSPKYARIVKASGAKVD